MMPRRIMTYAAFGLAVLSMAKAGDVIARAEDASNRTARQTAREFGTHDRPWARDLLAETRSDEPAGSGQQGEDTGPQACSYLDTLDTAIARAYVEPVETLRALDLERERLKREAQSVEEAHALAEATIIRAEQEVAQLTVLRGELQHLLGTLETEAEADIERMRALYEAMKPKAAADILQSMEEDVIAEILERMPDRRAAPILSNLPVDLARRVMRRFAERHRPGPA